jgi:hypothetical protein
MYNNVDLPYPHWIAADGGLGQWTLKGDDREAQRRGAESTLNKDNSSRIYHWNEKTTCDLN